MGPLPAIAETAGTWDARFGGSATLRTVASARDSRLPTGARGNRCGFWLAGVCAWCLAGCLCLSLGCSTEEPRPAPAPPADGAAPEAAPEPPDELGEAQAPTPDDDPAEAVTAAEETPATHTSDEAPAEETVAAAGDSAAPQRRGANLFARHCGACHGERGDGQGLAARFLFPKPRDLRAGRFRLVSTLNNVPTREDLDSVLARGMPGSAMVSWAHLSAEDRQALVDEIIQIRRDGARDIELQLAAEAEEELDEEELTENVDYLTTPGEVFAPPELGAATPESVARGRELYVAKGCISCHGQTGRGDGQQKMVDGEGFATRPRDLTLGIFKGADDPVSVYRRLWLGMPGSAMPASQQLTAEQVGDMVNYVLSLSDATTRASQVLRRVQFTVQRSAELPADPAATAWDAVPAQRVQTTHLWWRDEPDRDLQVQALHDGQSIAVRLTWRDATENAAAVSADEFEDMAALQLYRGSEEPFLGMGAHGAPVDVWQWRAGTAQDGSDRWASDEYPFDTDFYRERAAGEPLPDFLTARAAGNPLSARDRDGAHQQAAGVGSTTYQPAISQVVVARAARTAEGWQVVFLRPLAPGEGGGYVLEAGATCSMAFALWDGAAHDRAGQKLITMWNDLTLE